MRRRTEVPSLETLLKLILLTLGIGLGLFMVGMRFHSDYQVHIGVANREAGHLATLVEEMHFASEAEMADYINRNAIYWRVFSGRTGDVGTNTVFKFIVTEDHRSLTIILDKEKIWNTMLEENRVALVFTLSLLIASLQIGVLLAYSVTRPLQRLVWGFDQMATGARVRLPECRFTAQELIHITNAFNDMAEQLDRWREFQRRVGRMERLAALGEMASGVAHEIRNPLASMKIHLHLLRVSMGSDATNAEYLDNFGEELERLERKLNQFLDFARQGSARREEISPAALLRWTETMVRVNAAERGVLVKVEPYTEDELEGVLFRGDPDGLKQVLLNLAINGIQAMESGGALTLALDLIDGDKIFFSVADTGGGIPDRVRDRIFEPFVTSRPEGTGLGLAITKKIVEDHDGTLDFTTSPSGSRFFVVLPIDVPKAARVSKADPDLEEEDEADEADEAEGGELPEGNRLSSAF